MASNSLFSISIQDYLANESLCTVYTLGYLSLKQYQISFVVLYYMIKVDHWSFLLAILNVHKMDPLSNHVFCLKTLNPARGESLTFDQNKLQQKTVLMQ